MMIVLEQILGATAYIHEHKLVHGGVEPSDIWLMSRKPMNCKLGGFSHTVTSAYQAPEVRSRKYYLSDDHSADIWSIGLTVLRYSLFGRWFMQTSKWSDKPCAEAQCPRPGPGWDTLTDLANAMLHFDAFDRPSAKDCLEKIILQKHNATLIDGAKQTLANIEFLSGQKVIPDVPAHLIPLLRDLGGEAPKTVSTRKALSILKITQTGWEETKRCTLIELAAFLDGLGDMSALTDAMYIRNLDNLVDHVHLAEESLKVFVIHDNSRS